MSNESWNERGPVAESAAPVPEVTDRATWQAQLDELLVRGEGPHPGRGRDRGGPPAAADGRGGCHDPADRRARAGPAAGGVRGPPPADRVLPHVAHRQARRGPVRGLHVLQRAGPRAVLPALARRHLRHVLPRARTRRASATATSWAGRCRGTRRRTPPTRCSPGAGSACRSATCGDGDRVFETYWTTGRGRGGDGSLLRAARHDRVRPAGDLGGLAARLAPAVRDQRRAVPHATAAPPPSGHGWPSDTQTISAPDRTTNNHTAPDQHPLTVRGVARR